MLGSTIPRQFTPPLVTGPPGPCGCGCALTEETSYGFDVEWFAAEVLGQPLDPWQRWAVIHGGELLPNGAPRFRKLLVIVARQQGKTYLCQVLTLYWMFIERWPMILGTSTNLGYAKESWQAVVALAEGTEELADELPEDAVRKAAGEECLTTVYEDDRGRLRKCRYRIAASNRKGGRSLSIDRLILDELREHADWSAWNAAYNAMSARPFGQCIAITNMGDDTSVVLDAFRKEALEVIEGRDGDEQLGLLEWSAPDDADPEDPHALAQANPNLGRRTALKDLLADARRAKRNGGEELAGFLTEIMCIRVKGLNPAIDPSAWRRCLDIGDLDAYRDRVAFCLDIAPDGRHVTLAAAVLLPDGRVRVEAVAAWDTADEARRALPGIVRAAKPRVVGWFPNGPAAALATALADRRKDGPKNWPPNGVKVEEIRGEVAAACMGLAELVRAEKVAHSDDPLVNDHIAAAERLKLGDRWVFARRGEGHVDAAYAVAGAAHLAQTLPPPVGRMRLVVVGDSTD